MVIDKKFTDEEIIKGLNKLSLYTGFQEKHIQVLNAALDLINRQKAEIEALIAGQETLQRHFAKEEQRWRDCKTLLTEKHLTEQ